MASSSHPTSVGVLENQVSAERWRVAGERLRELSPEVFENLFVMLVTTTIGLSEPNAEKIT